MFFFSIIIAFSTFFTGADTAHATEVVEVTVAESSVTILEDGSLTAYVG